jgi:signal recognition particle GTPase
MARFLTLFGSRGEQEEEKQEPEKKASLFERMKQAVTRTRENLSERIEEVVSVVPAGKEIDRDTLDMLEATLLAADLGTKTTQEVLDKLRDKADRKQIGDVEELKRLLIAMQTSDQYKVATPADWQPGEDVIVPPPGSCGAAKERVEQAGQDYYCLDWFMCFKKLPKK